MKAKVKQFIENNTVKEDTLPSLSVGDNGVGTASKKNSGVLPSPIRPTKPRDCIRLISRLIYQVQAGLITESKAKSLTYLIMSLSSLYKDIELEKRITELEKIHPKIELE